MAPTDIDLDEANMWIQIQIQQDVFVDSFDWRLRSEIDRPPERVLAGVRILRLAGGAQAALGLRTARCPVVHHKAVIMPLLLQISAKQIHHMQDSKIHALQGLQPTLVQNRFRN